MRRVDILKMQLINSKGRFFTAEWMRSIMGTNMKRTFKHNFKVTEVEAIDKDSIRCRIFVPAYKRHYIMTFFTNASGDCTYIASDKSKFEMSGQQAFKF